KASTTSASSWPRSPARASPDSPRRHDMHFSYDEKTQELIGRVEAFMRDSVYPAEAVLERQLAENPGVWSPQPIVEELRADARARGLWNLFLPGEEGAGLSNLQYAPLCEILGRSPKLGPVATNCAAPDTGNMEILSQFGT